MKPSRTVLIGVAVAAAAGLIGWYSVRQSSDSSSSSTSDPMSGMTMTRAADTTTTGAMGHSDDSMGGMDKSDSTSMPGMIPLVAGADGTKASAGGLTLEPQHAVIRAANGTHWQLRVIGKDGMAVTRFQRDQTKLMHLIVVRNDLTGYQHLHPTLGRGGIFTVELRLPRPGTYRAIADFTTGGKRYALGVPVKAPGTTTATPPPAPAMTARVGGYSVTMMHKPITAGSESELEFTIAKNGKAVAALLPYLGAYGHLVALRQPDLAYSHVHPTSEDRARGMIGFSAEFPATGTYRLFLQFRTPSGVHTAPFTVTVS